ncbi:MAG: PaaI family thioesterase [Myxococcota bacterium]
MALDTPAALDAFFRETFPQAADVGFVVQAVEPDGVVVVLDAQHKHLRPGNVISGPTVMTLTDTAMYAAVLARLGPEAASSVTTSIEVHFLHRCPPGRLTARCRLLRVGRRLAVGTVDFFREDGTQTAHATITYALPAT